ncbi:CotH kinase family protein [Geomicrobium sp. JCM 19038]|uniref:CotH kinase family protein n=1 Tax=Geomicrobium sp. JCM 19038 TaxID=1460635 RepID=UPI0021019AEF|nr:CotH kinase family protein [Geomicrobium sp. JCM 19038]
MRFRGNSTRRMDKKSFNVRFEDPQAITFGSNRMNLNANYSDSSMMRDQLSFEMFRDADVMAPRTEYFNLFMNDSYEGLYAHVERVDSDLLKANGRNGDGTLVRDRIRDVEDIDINSTFSYDLSTVEDEEAFFEEVFDYRGDPEWQALAELITWVYETPAGDEFAQRFYEEMDAERVINFLAVHFLVGDIDAFGDDYWWYLDHEDPDAKWEFIPWDKDLTFGSHSRTDYGTMNDFMRYDYGLSSGWDNALFEKMLETPEIKSHIDQNLEQLMETFNEDELNSRIDRYYERIQPFVPISSDTEGAFNIHPQNHFSELSDFDAQVDVVREYIPLRYQAINTRIGNYKEQERDQVIHMIDESNVGEDVYFTNSRGDVFAVFTPSTVDQAGEVTLRLDELAEGDVVDGVQRTYAFDSGEADVNGQLTLYYISTNDVTNWYKDEEPIGDQWGLSIAERVGAELNVMETDVNPYTNRATSEDVPLNGTHEFVITQ